MVKEPKNIDFLTTGRQPSGQDFERISEWIRKKRQAADKSKKQATSQKLPSKQDLGNNDTAE